MRLEFPLDATTVGGMLWLGFPFGAPLEEGSTLVRSPEGPLDPGFSPLESPLAPGFLCLESPLDDALCVTVLPTKARMALYMSRMGANQVYEHVAKWSEWVEGRVARYERLEGPRTRPGPQGRRQRPLGT